MRGRSAEMEEHRTCCGGARASSTGGSAQDREAKPSGRAPERPNNHPPSPAGDWRRRELEGFEPRGLSQGSRSEDADSMGPSRGGSSGGDRPKDGEPKEIGAKGPSRGGPIRRWRSEGVQADAARAENVRAEGADLLGPSNQTNKRQESERKIRAVECRNDRALEMLRVRTAGQRRARQAMECQNDQASGQVIAQRHRHSE